MTIDKLMHYFNSKIDLTKEKLWKTPLLLFMAFLGALIVLLIDNGLPVIRTKAFETSFESKICFYPPENCDDLIAQEIGASHKSLHIMMTNILSKEFVRVIVYAKRRGVDVKFITNPEAWNITGSQIPFLKADDIKIKSFKPNRTSYNNFIVIDGKKVVTGSYDLGNPEDTSTMGSVIILNSEEAASYYIDEYMRIYSN